MKLEAEEILGNLLIQLNNMHTKFVMNTKYHKRISMSCEAL
jgi:hypothetical protein